ncbi:cdc42 effector protein 1b [Paralichthys olivaceus]|uniref:cdc42 effector protein 1b n=1 Tax=Paralichthys olivaceus TaxID=8255 RepID=UPI00097D107B|nr:PREDICTED: cdc42 effector protein 1-like [Paralichthys olivaceus]XP_019960952.1 PREDICTED: cdc42 effector protein 1-like [Paralichthys olivaceus]XP_019960953.1 PREDICTED: cdc42 effector protein 1-like [Paralichthys olivaceus]XP_019960954.1 PREDICTED: cdc42 effector protein 1-like [Paralichthys olivaceus]XP_019960955.1 PREDICTED: cdc42 effector protein 1-like [Paralichthys olivaceus]
MSLGKLPGMKGLVSGSQGKRRFKSDLSVDMISPPMGDFRHTMHVGRGGDVFGDTSFLSNYGGVREPGSPDSTSSSKTTGFFTRTFKHVRKNSVPRPRGGSRDLSPPPDVSPIIKNAISLPQLNMDSPNGCMQRMMFPSSVSATEDSLCTYGLQSGFVTLPRLPRFDRQFQDGDVQRGSLTDGGGGSTMTRSDSLASFTVDLGPSLMTEVLSLIDNPRCLQMSNHSQAADEEDEEAEEEDEDSLTETPVQSPEMTSPNPSMSSGSFSRTMYSRGRSCSSNRDEPEEDRRSLGTPDRSTGSPQRVESLMEAEKFQRAADVLSRHYGGGSFSKGTRMSSSTPSPALSCSRKTPYSFPEEEEEIKV